jgi:RNA polymerase sigma-70 factor (ECF subfamily)
MTPPRPAITLCRPDAPLTERSDDELMQLAGTDVVDAYAELVRRYQRSVRGVCTKLCGNHSQGDDVAQDVFLQVWRGRQAYAPLGKFPCYLFTLVRNACRNVARRPTRVVGDLAPDELPSAESGPLDELIAGQRRRRVLECIEKLPRAQREAIVLRFGSGLEYAEVAEVAGRTEATIRSRVFLGLARLRRLLGKGNEP